MAMIEQMPLLGSAALATGRTDADPLRPARPLSPLAVFVLLFSLFIGWAGFWLTVIWWIV